MILATALIDKLHSFYPDAKIDFLLRKGNESILANHPCVHEIHIWDKKQRKYRNWWKLLGEIRRQKYDAVVNVQRFLSTGMLSAFSGGKQIIGFEKNPLSFLFTKRVKHVIGTDANPVHEVQRNQKLIAEITDDAMSRPRVYPSEKDFQKVKLEGNYVTIAPASVWFTKQLPASKWIAAIALLPDSVSVYLIGSKEDFSLCESIRQASGRQNVINMAGQLTLLESAALMKNAQMNFVNDSAPLHLASAVNAPVTAVFCSTIPAFGFGPLSEQAVMVETEEKLECRPCGLHGRSSCPQGHFRCAEIDPAQIVKAVK